METYEKRVRALERKGLTRSDAQGVVDAEDMGAKHTPGPWKHQKARGHQHAIDRKWEVVAPLPQGGELLIVGEHTGIDCLNEANARLIASAPDLLAERDRLRAENAALVVMLTRITESHARLERERGSMVATYTVDARAALAQARAK